MLNGIETALNEITLVLFTTLVPSGMFACMLVALYLLVVPIEEEKRQDISQFTVIPLTISMVGLIASATHLGNPGNALYVFLGVGRSPLSNEVFFAVLFLAFTGLFWLFSFSRKQKKVFRKIWLAFIIASAIAGIHSIAFAYEVRTIISWNTVFIPINLWLNAAVGGPLLALFTLQLAKAPKLAEGKFARALIVLSVTATVSNALSMLAQNTLLPTIENSLGSVADLVPFYGVFICFFVLFAASALVIYGWSIFRGKLPSLWLSAFGCLLALIGIFLTRFAFYMMHLTLGLG